MLFIMIAGYSPFDAPEAHVFGFWWGYDTHGPEIDWNDFSHPSLSLYIH